MSDEREDAARKLRDRGIEPTEQRLAAFERCAAAQGRTLDFVVEAVLDAAVGEPERLKGLGVRGTGFELPEQPVSFSYRGVTVEAEQTAGSIADALAQLTGSL